MIGSVARWVGVVALAVGATARAEDGPGKERERATWPGMTRSGAVLLPNGWSVRPAGRQLGLGDFPVTLAENPKEPILAALHAGYGEHEVVTIDVVDRRPRVVARVTLHESFGGLAWSADGKTLVAGGALDGVVHVFDNDRGLLSRHREVRYPVAKNGGKAMVAGLALDGDRLWVADAFGHTLAALDFGGKLLHHVEFEPDSYPYAVAFDAKRGRVYVSLWNRAEVAVIDANSGKALHRWPTQEHPNELLLTRDGKRLFVANANRNTVSVFDAEGGKPTETIGTAIDPKAPPGSTPSALALAPDESILFVANANTNDLAVVNVQEVGASKPLGFIPTGWYPTSVRVSKDGKQLYITNGKGDHSNANPAGPNPLVAGTGSIRDYIGALFKGTLQVVPMPGPKEMAAYSKTVYECSPVRRGDPSGVVGPAPAAGNPVPAKVGDESPIKYVVYIIKENRTYDQVLGDIAEGNGEASLCLFPERDTPNHHALAREFVLLDNFYVDGEVSADGHEWSMGAYASDYVERTWPLSYRGNRRVPYPSEGALAISRPAGGYLWDKAAEKGITYRSYGEFIANGKTPDDPATTKVKALEGHFDPKFRSFDMDYPDVKRAARFLEEVAGFEKAGEMPRLSIVRLPNDHTSGTVPGKPTPTAFVADNDLALGRVVEGLSRSKFWPRMAIFVVEDDAQNGSDHVDAHRTVALAISPYTRHRGLDSTMYSTSSMLRTIELILGLDPMSQFDASARPMSNAFTTRPDTSPYSCRPARADLDAKNLATAWGAEVSKHLDLDIEDRADDLVFNEIIWKAVKGPNSPMPPPVRSAFVLPRK